VELLLEEEGEDEAADEEADPLLTSARLRAAFADPPFKEKRDWSWPMAI